MGSPGSHHHKPGSVRIIGGEWRRRRIALPPGVDLRPTPDRVRETLFNWLQPELPGAACLDLFAGTGVLGFEALSRGAAHAVFVERDARAAAALARLRRELAAEADIVRGEALRFLARDTRVIRETRATRASRAPRAAPETFDIVFVDPPYADPVDAVLAALSPWLKPGARVYLERARGGTWPAVPGFAWTRRETAGEVEFGLAERGRASPV